MHSGMTPLSGSHAFSDQKKQYGYGAGKQVMFDIDNSDSENGKRRRMKYFYVGACGDAIVSTNRGDWEQGQGQEHTAQHPLDIGAVYRRLNMHHRL